MARLQDLRAFRMADGFRGRPDVVVLLWQIVQTTLFAGSPQPAYGWRRWLLRAFGASVGQGVLVRPSVRITYPWNVAIADYCWIGDHVELYSLGPITIRENSVVSQRSYLCAGTHDPDDVTFRLVTRPVVVDQECWIAADCFIAPGVTIGRGAIVGARSTVLCDVPAGAVFAGNPAVFKKMRQAPAVFDPT